MKKETFFYDLKSGYWTNNNLESITNLFHELAKEENKKKDSYKREPSLSFVLRNSYQYTTGNPKEFVEKINNTKLNLLKEINFKYYGEDTDLTLDYSRYWFDKLTLKIETNDKKTYSYYKERIFELMGEGNHNWIFHQFSTLMVIFVILYILLLLLLRFYFKNFFNLVIAIPVTLTLSPILWLIFSEIPSKIYPKLIIDLETKKYGRNIKDDLWKIIIGSFSLVILPYILRQLGLIK